ncbi:MAG: GNAT family N-acetyltransferase [Usitatibacter sp.]
MTVAFTVAHPVKHRAELLELNIEYVTWVMDGIEKMMGAQAVDVLGAPVPEYVAATLEKVAGDPPPRGAFYIVEVDGNLAGMGGLRYLQPGLAEIKRVYVRPGFRGMKLGGTILARLLQDATAFGYRRAVLDTASFMDSAQRLYEAMGFVDCPIYEGVEVPPAFQKNWRFMERSLATAS